MPKFVSAEYVVNDFPPPEMLIKATDDQDQVYWLQDDCQQGDWLEFLAAGNKVAAVDTKSRKT